MYNALEDVTRALTPEDMVMRPIEYAFHAAAGGEHGASPISPASDTDNAFVSRFLEVVLPELEEREFVLRVMGRALFGDGRDKHFLVLTDDRDGSNGKTTLMRAFEKVFGRFAAPTQRDFLYQSSHADAKSQDSNLLSYHGARLAYFDEPDTDRKLDVRRLKDLTSGDSRQSARGCHQGDVQSFQWTHRSWQSTMETWMCTPEE
jgi:phage/plasmid-associated DNA primase